MIRRIICFVFGHRIWANVGWRDGAIVQQHANGGNAGRCWRCDMPIHKPGPTPDSDTKPNTPADAG